jgi:hypothetical protein
VQVQRELCNRDFFFFWWGGGRRKPCNHCNFLLASNENCNHFRKIVFFLGGGERCKQVTRIILIVMGTMKELLSAGIIPTYLLHSTIPFRTVLCMPILRLGGGMLVHFTEEAGMLFALSAVMGTVNVSSAPGSLEYNILKDSIN